MFRSEVNSLSGAGHEFSRHSSLSCLVDKQSPRPQVPLSVPCERPTSGEEILLVEPNVPTNPPPIKHNGAAINWASRLDAATTAAAAADDGKVCRVIEGSFSYNADHHTNSKYKTMITLLVGPSKEIFTVHKHLICDKSPFFDAACNGGFLESAENMVHLPEDQPVIVELFLDWLYTGEFASPEAESANLISWHNTAALYIFADKIQIQDLRNAVIDVWVKYAEHSRGNPMREAAYVYSNTPPGAPLRRLLVEMVARGKMADFVGDGLEGVPVEFFQDLSMRLMLLRRDNVYVGARYWRNLNQYHEPRPGSNEPATGALGGGESQHGVLG